MTEQTALDTLVEEIRGSFWFWWELENPTATKEELLDEVCSANSLAFPPVFSQALQDTRYIEFCKDRDSWERSAWWMLCEQIQSNFRDYCVDRDRNLDDTIHTIFVGYGPEAVQRIVTAPHFLAFCKDQDRRGAGSIEGTLFGRNQAGYDMSSFPEKRRATA